MREIKFRAWDKENKRWIKCFYPLTGGIETEMSIIGVQGDEDEDLMYPDDVDLIWYTGLKDKNGKEIYEGDIIKPYFDKWVKATKVEYIDGGFFPFVIKDWECTENASECEVIGNVFENPELLES